MSVELEWHFEDQVPEKPSREEHRPRRPRWQTWLGLAVAAALLAAGGLYAWWRVRRDALAAIEAEMQAVAELELRALATGDTELYLTLQDRADLGWYEAQQVRATRDDLLPPPLPGLTATTVLTVQNARVVGNAARVEFVRTAGPPGGDVASFRAVRFYRRTDDGGWLHTAADPGYAGHNVVFAGQQVAVTALATDAERLRPIASQLEGLADRFCALAPCRSDAPVTLVFTDTLDTAAGPAGVLPAPFVVGVPDDGAAQAAWEKLLQELLFDRLIARETGLVTGAAQSEPQRGQFFHARLRQWLRARLGLRDPISPNLELIGQALAGDSWIAPVTLWYLTPADDDPRRPLAEAEIDLLLAFIEQQYSPAQVARLLPALGQAQWIGTQIEDTLDEDWPDFEQRFTTYAREVTAHLVEPEPPGQVGAFAEYDLVAACGDPASLWGLRLDRPEATRLSEDAGFVTLAWSPDGTRLLAQRDAEAGAQFYLLEADGSDLRRLTSVPKNAAPVSWSPDGSHIAYVTSDSPGGGLVDVEKDEHTPLAGRFLAWSPGGARMTYATFEDTILIIWLAEQDGTNPQQVGEGFSMAWSSDGSQIAFYDMYGEEGLKMYEVATGTPTVLLERTAVYELMGFKSEHSFAGVTSVAWSPTGEWIGLGIGQVNAVEAMTLQGGALLIHPDGRGAHVPFTRETGATITGWSPNGRWLTCSVYDEGQFSTIVVDLDGESLIEASAWAGWSPGGQYLAFVETDHPHTLNVLEVESNVRHAFDLPVRCEILAWNPNAPLHEPPP
jgi:hypothetical protein